MTNDLTKLTLPIIDNCSGCGACCMQSACPPGYLSILYGHCLGGSDEARVKQLPQKALAEIVAYKERDVCGPECEAPCIWLNLTTRRCRYYEHRPDICREFEVGDIDCLGWREQYAPITAIGEEPKAEPAMPTGKEIPF